MNNNNDDDMYSAYPYNMRDLLKALHDKGFLVWSSDAAARVSNRGRGFYVPASSLVDLLEDFIED